MIIKCSCEMCSLSFTIGLFSDNSLQNTIQAAMLVCSVCGTSHQARYVDTPAKQCLVYGKPAPDFENRNSEYYEKYKERERKRMRTEKNLATFSTNAFLSGKSFQAVVITLGFIFMPFIHVVSSAIGYIVLITTMLLPKHKADIMNGYEYLGQCLWKEFNGPLSLDCRYCMSKDSLTPAIDRIVTSNSFRQHCPRCKNESLWVVDDYELVVMKNGRAVKLRFPWGGIA